MTVTDMTSVIVFFLKPNHSYRCRVTPLLWLLGSGRFEGGTCHAHDVDGEPGHLRTLLKTLVDAGADLEVADA